MKPRFDELKYGSRGNTVDMLVSGTPNQRASVAAYCSIEVVGTHLPLALVPESESSGPLSVMVWKGVPFDAFTP